MTFPVFETNTFDSFKSSLMDCYSSFLPHPLLRLNGYHQLIIRLSPINHLCSTAYNKLFFGEKKLEKDTAFFFFCS